MLLSVGAQIGRDALGDEAGDDRRVLGPGPRGLAVFETPDEVFAHLDGDG